jgi:TldD protein
MSFALNTTNDLFFTRTGLDPATTDAIVKAALSGCEDGELFLEYAQSEALTLDDGRIKSASFNTAQGFGLRSVAGDRTGYAHSGDLSEGALRRAAETVRAVAAGYQGTAALGPQRTNRTLYPDLNPLDGMDFAAKVKLLQEIDAYARGRDPRVRQVAASLSASWQAVQIRRADGTQAADIRPLVRIGVNITVESGGRMEAGSDGAGGRGAYAAFIDPANWQARVDEALRQALVNLDAAPAPAGEMDVVLGSGWPGVLIHEAVGHGLEGDFNRKNLSAFSGKIGEMVASPNVTIVDDGSIEGRRGSITIDDEGTPSERTVLIENGRLTGYMQDRLNARLMGAAPTGNGRRESYAHAPMPRMTNTFMTAGDKDPAEIIAAVKNGLYAVTFGGGQVDIVSGKFVFEATEAYLIENGKVTRPVKGAMLIGNGPEAMKRVKLVGHDLRLDPGIGTCGKDGQSVPAGVGQPTMLMEGLTVGGQGR